MSFTDQKPFLLDALTMASFKRIRSRFFGCTLCGYEFNVGDTIRWVYANGTRGQQTGNFFVCSGCNTLPVSEILDKAKLDLAMAVKLAKKWNIYGPDWEMEHR